MSQDGVFLSMLQTSSWEILVLFGLVFPLSVVFSKNKPLMWWGCEELLLACVGQYLSTQRRL